MSCQAALQAAALAALIALGGVLAQTVVLFAFPAGLLPQPYVVPADAFVQSVRVTDLTLAFFAADTAFVLGYTLVFAGLYTVTAPRAPVFAALGLGAGVLTALFDSVENALFIVYALHERAGAGVTEPALTLVYALTTLKWAAAFAALLAFGLVYPRTAPIERVIAGLMLLFPLVGVIGIALPDLIALRGLFFLAGMPLFAWDFWRRARGAAV
ncbi:MAG: hypothetical protein ACUVSX_00180 [Aggregatilineales bacterium]